MPLSEAQIAVLRGHFQSDERYAGVTDEAEFFTLVNEARPENRKPVGVIPRDTLWDWFGAEMLDILNLDTNDETEGPLRAKWMQIIDTLVKPRERLNAGGPTAVGLMMMMEADGIIREREVNGMLLTAEQQIFNVSNRYASDAEEWFGAEVVVTMEECWEAMKNG